MRKNIVAGNWKMNTTVPEGVQLAKEVCEAVSAAQGLKCDVIVGVPFTHLTAVREVIDINKVGLAAQNCADHTSGAYTGEVSAAMVASTGANYVIHLDPWWNPAIEQQATDRAYRIGQRQNVTVYHLIALHTIEEKILRLHESKRNLADAMLEGTSQSHKLTSRDLLEMISV